MIVNCTRTKVCEEVHVKALTIPVPAPSMTRVVGFNGHCTEISETTKHSASCF